MNSTARNRNRDLVYRRIAHKPDTLIIARRDRAFHVHQISQAINKAKTWKEFAAMLPKGEWPYLLERFEEVPKPSEDFNQESVPGFMDGDYPPWLQAEIDRCLPASVLDEFCRRENTMLNGLCWEISATAESALIDRLTALGYSVKLENDWLFH